jgi:hypothetical protein
MQGLIQTLYLQKNNIMTSGYLLTAVITIFIVGLVLYLFPKLNQWFFKETSKSIDNSNQQNTKQMQLQAYERLTLLVDRIALPNVISRLGAPSISCWEMQLLLNQNIKQEFEYNITQQIYVSADAWNSVKNLKDQNLLVVNQIGASMPAEATGSDLCKIILDFLMTDKRGTLHELVSEVLGYEARKLL